MFTYRVPSQQQSRQPATRIAPPYPLTFGPTSSHSSQPAAGAGSSFDISGFPIFPPAPAAIQPKLAINAPGDEYEQEAERLSEQVMQMQEPGVQRAAAGGCSVPPDDRPDENRQRIQTRHAGAGGVELKKAPPSAEAALRSPGHPLDAATRAFVEPRFGFDFSQVRVHTDAASAASAHDVNAHAYTSGRDIVFGAGRFAPDTHEGRRLLTHELTHVVQQGGATGQLIQRAAPTGADDGESNSDGRAEGIASVGGRVKRITIAAEDGVIVIETDTMSYLYELESWNIPEGSYKADVDVKGKDVKFTFKDQPEGELFHFRYRINRGQDNPATLLKGQASVDIDVVARTTIDPETKPLACLVPVTEKILIQKKTFAEPLFKPVKKSVEWTFAEIPLGFLGFIEAKAVAGVSLSGLLSGGWEDGKLTDICLFRVLDKDRVAGSARFRFGAAISPSLNALGKLEIQANYVGAVTLAALKGDLNASAIGRLGGSLDSRVDLIYNRRKDEWSLNAEALIAIQAGMKVTATAAAAIELLYKEVWRKEWNLVDADYNIGWKGGLRVGTDTRPRFDFGTVGVLSEDQSNQTAGPALPTATAPNPLATEAEVDAKGVLEAAINNDTGAPATFPHGQTPNDALPIIWYKPLNIYPKEIEIPRAITPKKLDRDDGPTPVNYAYGRGSITEEIGVGDDIDTGESNWPRKRQGNTPGKLFTFVEKTAGDNEKNRLRDRVFRDRLLPAGRTLASDGFDLDHVHEKQFGGKDALPNLWPARSAANQRAGAEHDRQLNAYRGTIGGLAGHWFEIVEIRNP